MVGVGNSNLTENIYNFLEKANIVKLSRNLINPYH
uniref:Uncharacterized protein n=1 Tax=Rhizophora mucronata TaxID=61149 RepID=A0A2P2QSL5_RHIMU